MSIGIVNLPFACSSEANGVFVVQVYANPSETYTIHVKQGSTIFYTFTGTATPTPVGHSGILPNGSYYYEFSGGLSGGPFTTEFTIACDTTPCDLSLPTANIIIVHDVNASGVGRITANATGAYAKEYSLDNVTWQSSNVFNNLNSGTYTVYVRDTNSCSVSKTVTVNNTTCTIGLSYTKTNETAVDANNGSVTAIASNTSGTVQYSLGGSYQSSPNFNYLPPGVYTLYVKDSTNCVATVALEIEAFDEPLEPEECFNPDIVISTANAYKFKIDKCDNADETITLYAQEDLCGVYKECFNQILKCDDVITLQIFYLDSDYGTIPILKIRDYYNNTIIETIEFTDMGSGFYQIEKNVNEISNICEKRVYLEVKSYSSYFDSEYFTHAISEPIFISDYHHCTQLITYWNDSDYEGIIYEDTAFKNKLRVEAQFWKKEYPQEKEHYRKSNGEIVKLKEFISEKITLEIGYVPAYIHEKIALALSHDHVQINSTEYVNEDEYSFDIVDKYSLSKGTAKLSTKHYYKKNLIR